MRFSIALIVATITLFGISLPSGTMSIASAAPHPEDTNEDPFADDDEGGWRKLNPVGVVDSPDMCAKARQGGPATEKVPNLHCIAYYQCNFVNNKTYMWRCLWGKKFNKSNVCGTVNLEDEPDCVSQGSSAPMGILDTIASLLFALMVALVLLL